MYQESVKDVLLYVKSYSGKTSRLKSFFEAGLNPSEEDCFCIQSKLAK